MSNWGSQYENEMQSEVMPNALGTRDMCLGLETQKRKKNHLDYSRLFSLFFLKPISGWSPTYSSPLQI